MPYITLQKRKPLQDYIDVLADRIRSSHVNDKDRNGLMNYAISDLIRQVYGPNWRYADVNDVMGMLASAQAEFYRKVAAPYENQKEHENGSVY
jgi:hypothetical protein